MTSYLLDPFIQVNDNNGLTVPGAKVYVYNADTTVPAVTYCDFEGHLNTNPVVADSLGNVTVIAEEGEKYDVVINYPDDTLLMSKKGVVAGISGDGPEPFREVYVATLDTTLEELDSAYSDGMLLVLRAQSGDVTLEYGMVEAGEGYYSFAVMPSGAAQDSSGSISVDFEVYTCDTDGWHVSYSAGDWRLATKNYVDNALTTKQDVLSAGANIQITGAVISATDTTYTAGTGLTLTGTEFSVTDPIPPFTASDAGRILTVGQDGLGTPYLGWSKPMYCNMFTGWSNNAMTFNTNTTSDTWTRLSRESDPAVMSTSTAGIVDGYWYMLLNTYWPGFCDGTGSIDLAVEIVPVGCTATVSASPTTPISVNGHTAVAAYNCLDASGMLQARQQFRLTVSNFVSGTSSVRFHWWFRINGTTTDNCSVSQSDPSGSPWICTPWDVWTTNTAGTSTSKHLTMYAQRM